MLMNIQTRPLREKVAVKGFSAVELSLMPLPAALSSQGPAPMLLLGDLVNTVQLSAEGTAALRDALGLSAATPSLKPVASPLAGSHTHLLGTPLIGVMDRTLPCGPFPFARVKAVPSVLSVWNTLVRQQQNAQKQMKMTPHSVLTT